MCGAGGGDGGWQRMKIHTLKEKTKGSGKSGVVLYTLIAE